MATFFQPARKDCLSIHESPLKTLATKGPATKHNKTRLDSHHEESACNPRDKDNLINALTLVHQGGS